VVFVPLKLVTVLAPFNVIPPTELAVSNAPPIAPEPDSAIVLELVKLVLPVPELIAPVIDIAPVLPITTLPPPVSLIPVIVNGAAVFVNAMLPLVIFVPLKFVTVFALFNVVPPTELVVNNPPLIKPAPASDTVPVPVNETLPLVEMFPAFNVTLRPAVALIAPDVLPTFALNSMSLVPPVADNVTVPDPPAVTALPNVCVPLEVKLIVPFPPVVIAPLVVNAPVLFTETFPPPVSLIPVIVNGAAVLINAMLPLVVFVPLKLVTVLAPFNVIPPTELAVSNAPPIAPEPDSAIVLELVKLVLPVPELIAPVIDIAPVLPITTLPPPLSLMPVMVNGAAVFVNAILPLVIFVPLKLVTVFALFNVVPPTELVVNNPPLIAPEPDSDNVPALVKLTAADPAPKEDARVIPLPLKVIALLVVLIA